MQQNGTIVLSFGNTVPSLKEWNHLGISAENGIQDSFLNGKKEEQVVNSFFFIFNNTNITKTLAIPLTD